MNCSGLCAKRNWAGSGDKDVLIHDRVKRGKLLAGLVALENYDTKKKAVAVQISFALRQLFWGEERFYAGGRAEI